ncbi:MAG TPA: ABC transporter permease [Acidobacteriota bacterium]|nr:ABC transporter permease [Acidobacteriota bacterium]
MNGFLQDLRYAFTNLFRSPVFAVLAIVSLALGIGANTAIFSIINTVLLRPLPYPQPGQLVNVWETYANSSGQGTGSVSPPNLLDWREQSESWQALAAYSPTSFNLTGTDRPLVVQGARMEPEMWGLLGIEANRGRVFARQDVENGDGVVVLSHGFWQRHFAGDPEVVGREIGLDGTPHTVIGIMPESFQCPPRSNVELWTPLAFTLQQLNARGRHWLLVLARLKPDVARAEAQSEMDGIAERIEEAYPDSQTGRGVFLEPLHESLIWRTREALWTLWAAVGFVLLIACANVANLLLARSNARRRELAVRSALGAGSARVLRQVLSESLLLALLGGAIGLILGQAAVGFLASLSGSSIPQGQPIELDLRVLGFCLAACLVTAVLAGILPALRSSRVDIVETLKERSQSQGASGGRDWLRTGLVMAEVALAVTVMMGAGLLLKSYSTLMDVDSGIETERLLTFSIPLSSGRYHDSSQITSFYSRLQDRLEGLPGVESVGMISHLPLQNWGSNGRLWHDGLDPGAPTSQRPIVELRQVGGDYFQAMGIRLLEGRLFQPGDADATNPPVIVNKAFADRVFDGERALGRGVGSPTSVNTIVGVVGDVRNAGLLYGTLPEIYYPLAASPRWTMSLVLRTSLEPLALSDSVRRAVHETDPDQPVFSLRTMNQVVLNSVADKRFNTLLMGIFALVAVVLAIAGVYGVLSYAVGRRTYEIAVRMALGAQRTDIYRLVIAASLMTVGPGLIAGALGSLWLTQYLQNQLFGVEATDPATLVAVCLILFGVSLTTALVPARRAAAIDPLEALRSQ